MSRNSRKNISRIQICSGTYRWIWFYTSLSTPTYGRSWNYALSHRCRSGAFKPEQLSTKNMGRKISEIFWRHVKTSLRYQIDFLKCKLLLVLDCLYNLFMSVVMSVFFGSTEKHPGEKLEDAFQQSPCFRSGESLPACRWPFAAANYPLIISFVLSRETSLRVSIVR